jgi:hypothetical protein
VGMKQNTRICNSIPWIKDRIQRDKVVRDPSVSRQAKPNQVKGASVPGDLLLLARLDMLRNLTTIFRLLINKRQENEEVVYYDNGNHEMSENYNCKRHGQSML